ncbi:MAG: DUF72 domain-containing protein [Saprospiraceae bacterium]|nr:DUF72 domain-containing protein [Saprospiraceae bacterium]
MKFGKLPDISDVDFSLPTDPAENASALAHGKESDEALAVYVGCTGWSMPEWVGKVYPPGTRSKDFLEAYGKQFNTIELNTTHYRIPTLELIQRWYASTPADFKFCPKIPQSISHSRNLGLGGEQIPMFCEGVQALEEKLGCCFMQLPPYFGLDRLGTLETFLTAFPSHIPLAIELRHESWFKDQESSRGLFELLAKTNTSTVLTDVAGRRDVLHMRLTNGIGMTRFVGNDLHPTDYERIDEWVARLRLWRDQGLKEMYFFTHEPDNLKAPELADYLVRLLKKEAGIRTRGPEFYASDQGEQMSLF